MAEVTGANFIPIPESDTTKALIGATQRSFDIIVPLSTATSNHKEVQAILQKIYKGGTNYIASVSESLKTAKSGFEFARVAQELCRALSQGRDGCSDELIYGSLAEMREIAQNAYTDAKATTEMFDSNRREFTEIRTEASELSKAVKTEHIQVTTSKEEAEANASSWKEDSPIIIGATVAKSMTGAILYEQTLQYLELAAKGLDQLKAEMDIVAEYWSGVNTELNYIDDQARQLRDDRRLHVKIRSLMRNWKGVEKDFKQYINALNTLLNSNPQYKGRDNSA